MLTVNYKNMTFKLPNQDNIFSKKIYKFVDEVPKVVSMAGIKPGGLFFEIGLCFGVTSISAIKLAKFREAYGLEADKTNCVIAEQNKTINKTRLNVYNYAASDVCGKSSMIINSSSNIGGHIVLHDNKEDSNTELITVDEFLTQKSIPHEDITFVWCDAQGSEGRILKKASKLLNGKVPWVIELAPGLLEMLGTSQADLTNIVSQNFKAVADLKEDNPIFYPAADIGKMFEHYKNKRKPIGNGKTKASHTNVLLIP